MYYLAWEWNIFKNNLTRDISFKVKDKLNLKWNDSWHLTNMYYSNKISKTYSKEKILEMYLNKINFLENWIKIKKVSEKLFNKELNKLNNLELSILSSLPKWPTSLSPYRFEYNEKRERYEWNPLLMWYLYISWKNDTKEKVNLFSNKDNSKYIKEIEKFKEIINKIEITKLWEEKILVCNLDKNNFKIDKKDNLKINKKWCINIEYYELLNLLNNIKIKVWDNYIEYQTWRKDFVLQRIFEDWKWNFEEKVLDYKKWIVDWILFEFK
jgi:hypothetical protein